LRGRWNSAAQRQRTNDRAFVRRASGLELAHFARAALRVAATRRVSFARGRANVRRRRRLGGRGRAANCWYGGGGGSCRIAIRDQQGAVDAGLIAEPCHQRAGDDQDGKTRKSDPPPAAELR